MTTTSLTSENLTSAYLSNYSTTSSIHSFTRRHSIYGTEDRVVLDIGSLYIKCGFSGESYPRHLVPTWSHLKRSSIIDGEAFRINGEVSKYIYIYIYIILSFSPFFLKKRKGKMEEHMLMMVFNRSELNFI